MGNPVDGDSSHEVLDQREIMPNDDVSWIVLARVNA